MSPPLVTAIVVNYRSGDHLKECLSSLLEDRDNLSAVLVVDNASGDDSHLAALRASETDPRVSLLMAEENLGLAGGVNLVLDQVETPYLAILNPDATVTTGWLTPLLETMEEDPGVGVACPMVVMEGVGKINSVGQHIHVTGVGFNRHLGKTVGQVETMPHDVDGLHGAAFLIRTEILRVIGGWDETGFLYAEDAALSWDVLLLGYRIVGVPASVVEHDYHLTMYPEKLHLLERNRYGLMASHLGLGRILALIPAILFSELMVWGLCLRRGRGFIRAKLATYTWLWQNRSRIADWRRRVMTRPARRPANLRHHTSWTYPLSQILIVGTERGRSLRVPPGGLPTERGGLD
jgi:GT2 family glycosyltransferase